MKKLPPPNSLYETIEGLRLTRNDVETIIHIFLRDFGSVKLSDNHFEFDSLEEFIKSNGVKPARLIIEAVDNNEFYRKIGATFEGNCVRLWGSQNTPFYEVKELLCSKSQWIFKLLDPWLWIVLLMIFGMVVLPFLNRILESMPDLVVHVTLGAPLILFGVALLYRRCLLGLRLVYSSEGGFFKRNAEKILLMFVGAVIGASVSWLFTFFGS